MPTSVEARPHLDCFVSMLLVLVNDYNAIAQLIMNMFVTNSINGRRREALCNLMILFLFPSQFMVIADAYMRFKPLSFNKVQ